MSDEIKTRDNDTDSRIVFSTDGHTELVVFEYNGDIYIKGKLIERDKDLVDAFWEFVNEHHFKKKER